MPSLPFYKLSPGGNMTLLFEAAALTPEVQGMVAAEALSSQHLAGEQAGFIDFEQGTLRMAGGEFCLNASRCFGLLLALRQGLDGNCQRTRVSGPLWQGQAQVSGLDLPVELKVRHMAGEYHVSLALPLEEPPQPHILDAAHTLLRLPGIVHLLVDAAQSPFPAEDWDKGAEQLRQRFDLTSEEAVGCIWWSELQQEPEEGDAPHGPMEAGQLCHLFADPVVAVRQPPTTCHERACGSGTLALALARYAATGVRRFVVMQPGGSPLTVCIQQQGAGLYAEVGGPVALVASGQAHLQCLAR